MSSLQCPGSVRLPAQTYRWLLFDADGTLFDYDKAESLALARSFEHFGLRFGPGHLPAYRRINQSLWQALEQRQVTPQALKVRRFELLLEEMGGRCPAAELSEIYLQNLADCSELVDGAEELLKVVQGKYRVAVVTNGLKAVQRRRLERSAIREHVSELLISEEMGVAKPAKEFFDHTFARLGHPGRETVLMIGDSWSSDILGGSNYGLDTCWYNPRGVKRPESPPITIEVRSLQELQSWLTPVELASET